MDLLLPDFHARVPAAYSRLHTDLWGLSKAVFESRIESLTPNDLTLGTEPVAMDFDPIAMDLDDGGKVDGEGAVELDEGEDEDRRNIGFINLHKYPALVLLGLRELVEEHGARAMFIVRHEYNLFLQHAMSRASKGRQLNSPIRFFVTGQPGIGKSFGCYFFLFYLLASGQPVFFLKSRTETLYFNRDGVQQNISISGPEDDDETLEAIRNSWVLIDIDDKSEWKCPQIFLTAQCVIWTSSPREPRMKDFVKYFSAERWYMKSWSTREIAAATQYYGMEQAEILRRMETGGPVPQSLFTVARPEVTRTSLQGTISSAISSNIFNFTPINDNGILLIEPMVDIDSPGKPRLLRTDYFVDFISPLITTLTLNMLEDKHEALQEQLAATFDIPTTRSLAGKVVEGLMHRALERGMQLPQVFGPLRTVVKTLAFMGKADSFVRETASTDVASQRPLYLRPRSQSFAAVDAILVATTTLGLIQTSPSDTHSKNFGTLLKIISRLENGANIRVDSSWELVYCLVGTTSNNVAKLVAEAQTKLTELQKLNVKDLSTQLSIRCTKIAATRISRLRVVGYTFNSKEGFEAVVV